MVYARALFAVVIVAAVGASFFMADGPLPSSEPGETVETEAAPQSEEKPVQEDQVPGSGVVVCPGPPPELDDIRPERTLQKGVRLDTTERALVAKAVQAQTDFAGDLYRRLAGGADGGNVFFSPHSISTILALTADGARHKTAKEMLQVLQLPAEVDGTGTPDLREIQAAIAALQKQLVGRKDKTELSVANAIWVDKAMPLRKPFVDGVLTADPKAAFENLDFRQNFEPARLKINDWAETNTNGRIKDLLPPGMVDELTRLVLTNAVYFKGDWAQKFDAGWTRRSDFTLADGKKIKTPLMTRTSKAGYAEFDGYRLLDLPYAGEKLSLLAILPDEANGLPAIEKELNLEWLAKRVAGLKERSVQVALPKFKLETTYALVPVLSAMGMPSAFDPGSADLTGFTDSPEGSGLYITTIAHKAFVEVNEEGSEAAAATAVVGGFRGPAPAPAMFIANRPFVFAIRHRESGQLLFLGRLTQPTPAE